MPGTRTLPESRRAELRARLADPDYLDRAIDRIAETWAADATGWPVRIRVKKCPNFDRDSVSHPDALRIDGAALW